MVHDARCTLFEFVLHRICVALHIQNRHILYTSLWFTAYIHCRRRGVHCTTHFLTISRDVLVLTLHPFRDVFPDERMALHCLDSGCIGLYTPFDDFPGPSRCLGLREISWSSGMFNNLRAYKGPTSLTTQYVPTRSSVRAFSDH